MPKIRISLIVLICGIFFFTGQGHAVTSCDAYTSQRGKLLCEQHLKKVDRMKSAKESRQQRAQERTNNTAKKVLRDRFVEEIPAESVETEDTTEENKDATGKAEEETQPGEIAAESIEQGDPEPNTSEAN